MKVAEAYAQVQFKLGRRRDLDEQIRTSLDLYQEELEKQDNLPWFLQGTVVVDLSIVPPATTPAYPTALPAAFLREFEDSGVYIVDSSGAVDAYPELKKVSIEDGRSMFGAATGQPCQYAFMGQNLHLFPRPDKAYTLEFDCYAADTLPSVAFAATGNAATNLWLTHAPLCLIQKTAMHMCMDLRDEKGAVLAGQQFQDAWKKLQDETITRMEQNNLRTMGEYN
jgi:hypothetical protein